MNLYALLSDPDGGYDTYAALVVAESRGRARLLLWREFGFGEALTETRYVCRLVERDTAERGPQVIAGDTPETHHLWALAKERTGIWQRWEDE